MEREHGVLDDVPLHHDHQQQLIGIHLGKLDELQLVLVIVWPADQRRIIGIRCQHLHQTL